MPFVSSYCCPRHVEWKHGEVTSDQLRSCSWEIRWLDIYRDLAISLNYFSLLKLTFHCIYK